MSALWWLWPSLWAGSALVFLRQAWRQRTARKKYERATARTLQAGLDAEHSRYTIPEPTEHRPAAAVLRDALDMMEGGTVPCAGGCGQTFSAGWREPTCGRCQARLRAEERARG